MRKWFGTAAVFCVALALPGVSPAQEPKEIVAKAIKAHGGLEKLKVYDNKPLQVRGKGKMEILGGVEFTLETSVLQPDKIRNVIQMQIMGQNVTQIVVFNGDNMWLKVNDMNLDNLFDDKAKQDMKEQMYTEKLGNLVTLVEDKKLQLSPLGETMVEGKPAVGIRVSSEGHKDVSLWFDKTTSLLVRSDSRTVDFQTKMEQDTQRVMLDYKDKDGMMVPGRMIINKDDKKFMDMELEEVKILDRIDDSVFAKP